VKKLDFNMDDDSNRSSVVTTPYGQQSSTSSYTSDSLNQYELQVLALWADHHQGYRRFNTFQLGD